MAVFTEALEDVSRVKFTYPSLVLEPDMDRRQVLYYIAGWLLSSGLTRVTRDGRLSSSFLPFVNSHKYSTAEAFREAHPEAGGLEFEVVDRNVQWNGKGLIFASKTFFDFVYTLESGYRHALMKPALLATYLGDLPAEIFRVVSSASPVIDAWAHCVQLVREAPSAVEGGLTGRGRVVDGEAAKRFDKLFHFCCRNGTGAA